ncbi:hypothetical protein ACQ4M4_06445 [Leptolyngbya sp. AN02str]|uniref:hypothetical protein n=1 Tax=Leptolyngbya sp. AN02str TaxID=3423363 RepID=UPI003D31AB3A
MQATERAVDLRSLGHQLETYLSKRQITLGVRCALQDERLIIVGHHRADTPLEPVQTLRLLQRLVKALHPAIAQRVQMYLRKAGEQTPYARCHFVLQSPELRLVPGTVSQDETVRSPANPAASLRVVDAVPQMGNHQSTQEPTSNGVDVADAASKGLWNVAEWDEKLTIIGGLSVIGLAMGGYTLAQPCVLGDTCSELQTATVLQQESSQILKTAASQQDLIQAQAYLQGALGLLETVPQWSGRSPEARQLSTDLTQQLERLNAALSAASLAQTASQQSQVPLYDASSWDRVLGLWQRAIQQLKTIPQDSNLYRFAQTKQAEYEQRMAQVQMQMQQETEGRKLLSIAKQEIQLAQAKHAQAKTPEDWQLTQVAWQVALSRLQNIPQQTVAGMEAQRLLDAYGKIPKDLGDRLQAQVSAMQYAASNHSAPGSQATQGGQAATVNPYSNDIDAMLSHFLPPPPSIPQ